MSKQVNLAGLFLPSPPWNSVTNILAQVKAYIWNKTSMSHLELVAGTRAPDSLLPSTF